MFHFMEQTTSSRTAGAVRAELARRKLSGRKLADGLGWSVSKTWRRLSGEHPFDINELAAVAAYLGIPVGTFLPDRDCAA